MPGTGRAGVASAMPAMHSADAAWLRMDRPTNPMVINSLLRFDGRIDLGALRDRLQERLVDRFPRFRQRPAGDALRGLRWEDDPHFDIDLHLQHVALPAPGDEAALRDLVSDLISVPLDHDRALWSTHAHRRPGRRLRAAVAHAPLHRRRDRAGARDADAGRRARRGAATGPAHGTAARRARCRRRWARWPVRPARPPRAWPTRRRSRSSTRGTSPSSRRTAARDAGIVAKFVANPPDAAHAAARQARRRSARRLVAAAAAGRRARPSPTRSAPRSTTCCWPRSPASLGDHLRAAGGTVPDEVHAMVPFNLRAADEPLPRDLGNRFGLLLLGLPVGIEEPVARLLEVRRRTDAIKHSHEGQIAYGILAAMGTTPSAVEARLIDLFSAKATAGHHQRARARASRCRSPGVPAERRARVGAVVGQPRA